MEVFILLGRRLEERAVPEICMLVMQFVPVQMMCGVWYHREDAAIQTWSPLAILALETMCRI